MPDEHDLDDFAPPLERVERRMDLMAQQIAYLQGWSCPGLVEG